MRSGNYTAATQWLYLFGNLPYFWVVKIGIGGRLKARERQVDKSAKGIDFIAFAFWFPYAYQVEQLIHRLCRPFRLRSTRGWGSGKTERFYLPAAIAYFLVGGAWFVLCWGSVAALLATFFGIK